MRDDIGQKLQITYTVPHVYLTPLLMMLLSEFCNIDSIQKPRMMFLYRMWKRFYAAV